MRSFVSLSSGLVLGVFVNDVVEAVKTCLPHSFEFFKKFVRSSKLVDFAADELFAPAALLRDEPGIDEDFDVFLYCRKADWIEPAEFTDGALAVERLRHDVASCGVAERKKQAICLALISQSYNHIVVGYTVCQQS